MWHSDLHRIDRGLLTGYLHSTGGYAQALLGAFGIMFVVVAIFRQLIPLIFLCEILKSA
jgi:hypothetical protein